MFTGIIQGLGKICASRLKAVEARFIIQPQFTMKNIVDGESISVNGVCLSVEKHEAGSFTAYASEQTLSHTTLAQLRPGNLVNLERALAFGERLGGHLVSGHIDCVATVREIVRSSESLLCAVNFPPEYASAVIPRGSIALDGISLTITDCGPDFLQVNVIPDSQKRTNMPGWQVGTRLNMETDLVGKYVANFARIWLQDKNASLPANAASGISREFLAKNGFL